MVDIFDNLIGGFEGYALENLKEGNPNPELDTTNFEDFFGDNDFNANEEEERPKKKKAKKKKRKQVFIKSKKVFIKSKGTFGGF